MSVLSRFRNRIVRYREVDPNDLVANPLNWRIHSATQQLAMTGSLVEVGWIAPVITQDGTDYVIDGHMRVAIALRENEPTVPVVDVDLDDDEAATMIATFDPLGAMAITDREKYAELYDRVDVEDAALREIIETMNAGANLGAMTTPPDEFPSYDDDIATDHECPKCGYQWSGGRL